MTVSSSTGRVAYTGDGATLAFSVPFKFLVSTDLAVYLNNVLQVGGYSTAGAGSGSGTVTFATAPAAAVSVVILRNQPYSQDTSLAPNGPFPAKSVEVMADKVTIGLQQLAELSTRTLNFPVSDGPVANNSLPAKASRLGLYLAFDANGDPTGSSGTGADAGLRTDMAASGGLALSGFIASGANAVPRTGLSKAREVVSADDYFTAGATDDTVAIQRAITAVGAGGVVNLHRDCTISSATVALQISLQNVTISGGRKRCTLTYTGAGVAIALGTDDGLALDAGNYDGPAQGFRLHNVDLVCANDGTASKPRTALANSITAHYYGTGTYGVRDWRGGYTKLESSSISGFEYGYWGVQADLNSWHNTLLSFNHVAALIGPRSDQGTYSHIWTFGNDTVWKIEGARHLLFSHWITDTDGSGTTYPCQVNNSAPAINARYATTRETSNIVFDQPWCEQLGTFGTLDPGYAVDAVFSLGVGDPVQAGGVVIKAPFIATYDQSFAAAPHFYYLVRAANVKNVTVTDASSPRINIPWSGMKAMFVIDASTANVPLISFSDADGLYGSRLIENYKAASCVVQFRTDGFTDTYTYNVLGGTGAVLMGGLGLQKRLVHNSVPEPTHAAADITLNRGFTSGKSFGWIGDGGSAIALHAPTLGANRGDVSVTLTPETDAEEQSFFTSLTADRSVVLNPPAVAAKGYIFAITRYAGGAFNLNVLNTDGVTLIKAMPASSWAVFMYDGSTWLPRRYGAL